MVPNTPASSSGLRRHDVIVKIAGAVVTDADGARVAVDGSEVGKPLRVTVVRGEKEVEVVVVPEDLGTVAKGGKKQQGK